jgi:REP element-mobilizing transposase RayT
MPRSCYTFYEIEYPYFMTATVNAWIPIFTRPDTVNIVLDSWHYLQQNHNFKLFGYVILENHIHLIAQSPQLSKDMRRFKSYTARRIIDHLQQCRVTRLLQLFALFKRENKVQSSHQVWEEGSHPQCVGNAVIMQQKLEYIHQNPVKRGYVEQAEHWRYSSAGNYAGQPGLIEVVTDW